MFAKEPAEGARVLVAAAVCDVVHGEAGRLEIAHGGLDPGPLQVLLGRFARGFAKATAEGAGAHAGAPRETCHVDVGPVALLDLPLDGLDALVVVPALGPRLSWLEFAMKLTHRMEKYEDDLRDQWQSRSHRKEWRRFLEALARVHRNPSTPVTVVSGEIHLATRGTFDVPPAPLHQLVASGIAHPAPPLAYARTLGALAKVGETPVPGHPIRLHPLPGQLPVYTAQRNYLILERHGETWRTWWELEEGATPAIEL